MTHGRQTRRCAALRGPNAGWSPAYDARLRSADRAVDLDYFGVVRNGTGEDWKDIALTLVDCTSKSRRRRTGVKAMDRGYCPTRSE
jgi:hypothetical protein